MMKSRALLAPVALVSFMVSPQLAIAQQATVDAAADVVVASAEIALPSCAGGNGAWIGDTAEASDPIEANGNSVVLSGQGPISRAFQLAAPAQLRLEAVARESGDPSLRIVSADGNTIAENDDALGTLNSQIVYDLPAGIYCAVVDDLRGAVNSTLQVAKSDSQSMLTSNVLACTAETEAGVLGGETLEAALAAGVVSTQVEAGRNSYLRFTLSKGQPLSLSAVGGSGVDPQIALFDAAGNQIAQNDDADGLNARLDFQPELAPGTYCIGTRTASPSSGLITVAAQKIDIAAFTARAYARGQLVPTDGSYPVTPLRFNQKQAEVVLQGSGVTWYSFELDGASVISVATQGSLAGADTDLKLFNAAGRMLQEVDDIESDRNARLGPMELEAGRYYVALSDRQASEGLGSPLRPISVSAKRYVLSKE